MLVVGISFSTTLSLCCMICCVIFFIAVKRNKRLAFENELKKKQKLVDKQIDSLEETLKDVESEPVPSPSDIEQPISTPDKTGVLYKGDIRTQNGKCWMLGKAKTKRVGFSGTDMVELDSVQNKKCTQFEKIGIGKYAQKDNNIINNAFILRDVKSKKCLDRSLVAVNSGSLIPCPVDDDDNISVLNNAAVLKQDGSSIMVLHDTGNGTTCIGESMRHNTKNKLVPVTTSYGETRSGGCTEYKSF